MRMWMMRGSRLVLVMLAAGGLVGCQGGLAMDRRELRPWVDGEGESRSLAFASRDQRVLTALADFPPGRPWYAERADVQPWVEAGVRAPTWERSRTITVDRQRSFRGRVFDSFHETIYRERLRETWR